MGVGDSSDAQPLLTHDSNRPDRLTQPDPESTDAPTRPLTGPVSARLRAMRDDLQPAERSIVEFLLAHGDEAASMTASAVAAGSRTSAASVVRTCQRLGYTGYQQMRVLLTRDALVAQTRDHAPDPSLIPGDLDRVCPDTATGGERIRTHMLNFATQIPSLMSLLDTGSVDAALDLLEHSSRVLVIASGLSSAVGKDLAARLLRVGCDASCPSDIVDQHVAAEMLGPTGLAITVSASGANAHSLRATQAAKESGASVLALTSSARSSLTRLADQTLVMAPAEPTYAGELAEASRLPLLLLVEALVLELSAPGTRQSVLTAISEHVKD